MARRKKSTPLEELQRAYRKKWLAFNKWVSDPANGISSSEHAWFLNAYGWQLLSLELQIDLAQAYVAVRDRWPTAYQGGPRRRKLEEMVLAAVHVADSLTKLAAA